MTCIVGLVENDTVWLGADSAGVAGRDLTVRSDPKVFINGEYAIGFTSSFRMGQLLHYSFNPPEPATEDLPKFMSTVFVNEIRECFKLGGYQRKDNEVESGGTFLVGVKGRLFYVGGDYQVGTTEDGYMAVGCGAEVARGSLYATRHVNSAMESLTPESRLIKALSASEHHNAGVRAPFRVVSVA